MKNINLKKAGILLLTAATIFSGISVNAVTVQAQEMTGYENQIEAVDTIPEPGVKSIDSIGAANSEVIDSGSCGENVYWSLSEDGTLSITGNGKMKNYTEESDDNGRDFIVMPGWFKHEKNIIKVVISNGVTSIGINAFLNCSSLTSIEIPNSIIYIGYGAFKNCSSLTSIEIPSGVEDIGSYVFMGCNSLTSIKIPDSVTEIGNYAFGYCSNLTSVEIPDGVTEIGRDAFVHCSSLISVEIPNSVTYIGDALFWCCSNLASIKIPNSVTEIGEDMFYGCSSLANVRIPNSVTIIGRNAFSNCSSLKSIEIPNSVVFIGDDTFEECSDLIIYCVQGSFAHQYAIENSIPYKFIQSMDSGKDESEIPGSDNPSNPVPNSPSILENENPTAKASLSKAAITLSFNSCNYNGKTKKPTVKSVKLGSKTLKSGTDYTVSYANNKNIGTATVIITGRGNYTGTAKKTFKITAKKGSKYTVGANRYKITGSSTVSFISLKSAKTTKVTIPKTTKIGGKNFKVTAVEAKALQNMKKVTSVTIGANVSSIGKNAFTNCRKLGTITIKSTKLKTVGKNAFKGIKSTAKIKVPAKKLSAYKKLLKGKGQGRKVKIVK